MADIEKSPIITFRTDDSGLVKGVTSLKELKLAISQMKDEIVRMRQAGEDTTKATTELQAAQRELNTVLGLTKKSADGVEGSYDSLVAKLREAKTEWRSLPKFINGELNPAWDAARQKVEQYNTELKDMDASVGNYQRNVGNYKSALEGFSGTMGQAAQIGGDFRNGLQAVSSMMLMAGANTDGMNDAMKALQITVGVLQGLKGMGGLLNKLRDYLKLSVQSVTTTKADTAAKEANTAATTAMAGAETAAAGATTILGAALKAIGIGLIISALAFVVSHLQDIVKWITNLGEKLGIVKKQTKEWEGANDRLSNRFKEQNRELNLQQKVLAAQGVTKKALLEQQKTQIQLQINETKATIANIEARVKQMQADSGWVRFWKGENRQIRKAQEEVEALTESLKGLYQNMQEVNVDIKVEEINADNTKNQAATQASAAALKAIEECAKKAQANIDKILDSSLSGVEKIKKEYEELFKQLDADEEALKRKAEKDNKTYDGSAIASARLVLEQQQTEKLRAEYKKQFDDLYAGYRAKQDVLRKEEKETDDVYKGLIATLKDNLEEEVKIEREQSNKLLAQFKADKSKAFEVLESLVGEEQREKFREYASSTDDALKYMYQDMLENEKEFAKQFPEPFITALKTIGPLVLNYESEIKENLKRTVNNLMAAYKEAVERQDFKAAKALREQLLGNPPVADDETLKAAAEDFVNRMDAQIYSAIAESENPFEAYVKGTTWDAVFGSENEPWRKILADETATWAQEWEARGKIINNFGKRYDKFMASYGAATSDVLTGAADLWDKLLQIQVKNGKKSEEQAKKEFKVVKGLQIAAAVINTAAAVTNALSKGDPYTAAARAIAVGLMGAAQVATIAATEFNSPASTNVNTEAPTLTQSAPMVNTYGINPADYAEANAQNPVRVYVLEEDITNAQQAARTRVAEATF